MFSKHRSTRTMRTFLLIALLYAIGITILIGSVYAGYQMWNRPLDKPEQSQEQTKLYPVSISSTSKNEQIQAPNKESDEVLSWHDYPAVEVTATGYYAGVESTGKSPGHPEYGITFSGLKVLRDETSLSTIAADPDIFPIGSILYIPGYGYGIVADTGSAVKGHTIDLYFDTINDVFEQWGKKKLNVYVIEEGAGKITETVFNQKRKQYQTKRVSSQ